MTENYDTHSRVLEYLPEGVYILDRELVVRYLNPSMIRMLSGFGLPTDLVGRRFIDVFAQTQPYLGGEIESVYASREHLRVRHSVNLPGSNITVSYETVRIPMINDSGEISGVLNTVHNVTDYLKVQEELRASQEQFEIMVDNANSVILRMDLTGRITYFNRFAELFFGYTREEIIGRLVQETIIPPTDVQGHKLSGLIREIIAHPADFAANENENVKKDGSRVWVSWSNKPIFDAQGKVTELLCVGNDITALKKVQEELVTYRDHLEELVRQQTGELVESEARYRFLFEDSPTLSVIIAPDGAIMDINKAMARSLGYERKEMIGKNSFDFFIPEQKGDAESDNRQRVSGESRVNVENYVRAKDGTVRVSLTTGHRQIFQGDRIVGVLLCGIDITEKKKLEEIGRRQQEELIRTDRLSSLGTLVSGVAHEINNPNNFIILNADNLVDIWKEIRVILDEHARTDATLTIVNLPYTVMREEMDHLIGGIRTGARRIRNIVAHLKDFARQGSVEMDQCIDFGAVIEAACVIVANPLKKATAHFSTSIEPNLPKISGNFQKLEQLIINLLANACEALTNREQAISVAVSADYGKSGIKVFVRDEGRGIEPDTLAHIFDPFFTTRRDSGGTGLGLSISYGIVKDHQGAISVTSIPGKGTEFAITLPGLLAEESRV